MNRSLVLLGGGGHCRSCIEAIESEGRFSIHGVLGRPEEAGSECSGYRFIGTDADIPALAAAGHRFLITVGQIESAEPRARLAAHLDSQGAELATVMASTARVSGRAKLGRGTVILHGAMVNAGAMLGDNCIVNTGAIVEHDAVIGSVCHVSTGALVNGGARIGDRCFLGSGCVVSNHVEIAADCVIGAGAVVTRSIDAPGTYAGSPARKLR